MIDLRLGDCLDVMRGIPDASVDAVITDPPYGTGHRIRIDGTFEDFKEDWDEWNSTWLSFIPHCEMVAFFCPPKRLSQSLNGGRLLTWCSPNPVARMGVSPRYGIQPIVAKGKFPVKYGLDWFAYHSNIQTPEHPHEKPIPVMQWLIEVLTNEGDTILDPFMGSGTTGVACVKLNRNFIGIEINPQYFAIAERRVKEAQAQLTMAAT